MVLMVDSVMVLQLENLWSGFIGGSVEALAVDIAEVG